MSIKKKYKLKKKWNLKHNHRPISRISKKNGFGKYFFNIYCVTLCICSDFRKQNKINNQKKKNAGLMCQRCQIVTFRSVIFDSETTVPRGHQSVMLLFRTHSQFL